MRCTLWLLILCGCAARTYTPSPNPAPPPIPKTSLVSRVPEAVTQFTLSYGRDFYLPFQYPPDATNYTWSLQESLDNTNWITIQQFTGGVVSNYNFNAQMNGRPIKFWRLRGVKN